ASGGGAEAVRGAARATPHDDDHGLARQPNQLSSYRRNPIERRTGGGPDPLQASSELDLDSPFSNLIQQRVGGLVISADTFFSGKRDELATLAFRHVMP